MIVTLEPDDYTGTTWEQVGTVNPYYCVDISRDSSTLYCVPVVVHLMDGPNTFTCYLPSTIMVEKDWVSSKEGKRNMLRTRVLYVPLMSRDPIRRGYTPVYLRRRRKILLGI